MWRDGADLHFHLLHGVDDGPADLADSLELARAALRDGSSTVVATPHVRGDFVTDVPGLTARMHELRAAIAHQGLPLRVLSGGELGHDLVPSLDQRAIESLAQGPPEGRWVLLEAPWDGYDEAFHAAAGELRERGFAVVIAHPERSGDAELDDAAGLRRELAAGSRAQLNAQSLSGGHGPAAERAAFRLIAQGLVTMVASDAHGPTRPPSLCAAFRRLVQQGISPAAARVLTHGAPRQLLARGVSQAAGPVAA
jgi:protein-tyrosine phosphatase